MIKIIENKYRDKIMKAQVIQTFGDPNVFKLINIPKCELIPGHVLIRVKATSVNPIDCKIRSGALTAIAPDMPAVLQGDVAGIIEAVSPDVKNFSVGDEVYGYAGGLRGTKGALAEYMLADAKLLAKKPTFFSMTETAALPLVAITAWEALFNKAKITKDKHILIHGGIGGVGHIAVQLAKWCGAKVSTTVLQQEDFSLAKSLGADEIINAKEEQVEDYVNRLTQGRGFDIVFDTVGGPNLDRSFAAAAINGTVVTIVARSTHDLTVMHNKGLSLHVIFTLLPLLNNMRREEYGKILEKISGIVNQKQLRPLIDPHKFTLETVRDAHVLFESGKAQGKVVIIVD